MRKRMGRDAHISSFSLLRTNSYLDGCVPLEYSGTELAGEE